jgi:hypothetical protein
MKRPVHLFIAMALTSVRVFALDTAALLDDPANRSLLEKNCIQAEVCGILPVRFGSAVGLLAQPDLIQRIQTEYDHSFSKNGISEFPIRGAGNGMFSYIDEEGQRTDIQELCRRQTSAAVFDLVYRSTGQLYFGNYDSLIHIRTVDAGVAGTFYMAAIQIYPDNPFQRFFARRFGTIERALLRKTRLVALITTRICDEMEVKDGSYSTYTNRRIESVTGLR